MNKKINENIEDETPYELVAKTAKNAFKYGVAKPVGHAVGASIEYGKYKKVAISDIISYAINKKYIKQRDCSSIESDVIRFQCYIHKYSSKIRELEKASHYCKYNSDESLCKLRLAEKIKSYQDSIIEYQDAISKYKNEEIELAQSRDSDPNTYYDNEYQYKEFE